jgi:hypothetical protein
LYSDEKERNMRRFLKALRNSFIPVVVIVIAALSPTAAFPQEELGKEGKSMEQPAKGFAVTLSVYSGRPNPQWWITPQDPDFTRLVELIGSLRLEAKPLFKYDEWNRLGYASFWIASRNVKGLPRAIHVWRDMAYVIKDREGVGAYALGAAKLYDMLVAQAERRGHKEFFVKYRELDDKR